MKIWIAQSVLTRPLVAGLSNLKGGEVVPASGPDVFVITETARFAAFPDHRFHPEAGIVVRDNGVIMFHSAVRADELDEPVIWVRTETATAELVARATLQPYFGFHPTRWVSEGTGEEAGVVTDEIAALAPSEAGFREDLTRAWFVLTGLPLVTHLLAIPSGAAADDISSVAAWIRAGGRLEASQNALVIDQIAGECGAERASIEALMTGVRWTMEGEERIAAGELFLKSRVATGLGPIPWDTSLIQT